jgi:hypothetical protein
MVSDKILLEICSKKFIPNFLLKFWQQLRDKFLSKNLCQLEWSGSQFKRSLPG